jgi:hypothetical protein
MLNALIVCCLMAQAPALPPGTEVEYDKFDDYTHITLDLGEFTTGAGRHDPSIATNHKGKDPKAANLVAFFIDRYGSHWEYLKHHDVTIMCGDKRLKIRRQKYESETNPKADVDEYCEEHFFITVAAQDMQDILELNKDLEVKIGIHEPFTIGPKSRDKMLKFVKAVQSGAY